MVAISDERIEQHRQRVAAMREAAGLRTVDDINRSFDEAVERIFPDKESLARAVEAWWDDPLVASW